MGRNIKQPKNKSKLRKFDGGTDDIEQMLDTIYIYPGNRSSYEGQTDYMNRRVPRRPVQMYPEDTKDNPWTVSQRLADEYARQAYSDVLDYIESDGYKTRAAMMYKGGWPMSSEALKETDIMHSKDDTIYNSATNSNPSGGRVYLGMDFNKQGMYNGHIGNALEDSYTKEGLLEAPLAEYAPGIYQHELAHAANVHTPEEWNNAYKKGRKKPIGDQEDHDDLPREAYADFVRTKIALRNSGLYDTYAPYDPNNLITKEILNKYKKTSAGQSDRFIHMYDNDDDVLNLLNNFAYSPDSVQKNNNGVYMADKGKNITPPKFDGGTVDNIDDIVKYIIEHEGFDATPRIDTISKTKPSTAGYGFTGKQHQHNWTKKDAEKVLRQMVTAYDEKLTKMLGKAYTEASPARKIGYHDLMHQVGIHWNEAMPKFYAAALAGDEKTMQRELNWGVGQTDNRNNDRRRLFGYAENNKKGSIRVPKDFKKITFTNPDLPLTEPQDNTFVQKPDTSYIPYVNPNNTMAAIQNRINSKNSLQNIYNMAQWNPNNTLPEVTAYGTDRNNRLMLPSLKSMMEKQLNPMKQLNQNFEDYVSNMMNPMKYQIKIPNIFENM